MFKKIFSKIAGDPDLKLIQSFQPLLEKIGAQEAVLVPLPDEALRQKTVAFKERLAAGETLDDLLPEAFALVREASRRTTGLRHYDVQIMGGSLLHEGQIVEMRTGEGKTLVATLPLYLNALTGRGAHLVTVNEYLARRDGGWMGKIFHFLGLSVAVIAPQDYSALYDPEYVHPGAELEDERLVHWRPCTRQEAYQADITYGIASEFGFDYLRDNLVTDPSRLVQRELHYGLIDEVDNILIDEARTPLIISGPASRSGQEYERFSQYIRGLRRNTAEEDEPPNGDYDLDEKSRSITLTESGIAKLEERIPEIEVAAGDSLYDPRFYHLTYYVENALKAQYLFKRDHEYVVQNNEVIIVDDFTGRLMPGRRYSDGLHEAIEAKEGVTVQRENVTVATITLQNYFRMYEKLGGMTGTAMTDAEEFKEIYDVEVSALPTNVQYVVLTGSMGLQERRRKRENTDEIYYVRGDGDGAPVFFKRVDHADQVYGTGEAKDEAIVKEIVRVHQEGRPVLVGTTSVEHSEVIHHRLQKAGISHQVLNAKIHQSEALVVAQAGRRGAVTISTNMAGRGTDIILGGNPEGLAVDALENDLFDRALLALLSQTLAQEGEEAARDLARRHAKLTADLVDRLLEIEAEFARAAVEIEGAQVIGYVARQIQDKAAVDYNQALQVVRLARAGLAAEARQYLRDLNRDVALVEEVVRLSDLFTRYLSVKDDQAKRAAFFAENLFEVNYKGRAALIRAVMAGDRQQAEQVVREVPGLTLAHLNRVEEVKRGAEEERREVWQLGGLHVVGSERHESRRIDNQLRGRAARQGDPGSSRFFLSLEDDLMRRFGGERLKSFMARTRIPEDMPIESGMLDRLIESSQERIEGYNFDIRKSVVEYDDVMSKQRQAIYGERRSILMGEAGDLDERIGAAFASAIEELAENYLTRYQAYVRGEIDRAIQDFSTEATGALNVNGVLLRLRSLLPQVAELNRADLAELSGDELAGELAALAAENEEQGVNIVQFLQAMGRFVPIVPATPNLAAILASRRSGQVQIRERLRVDFLAQVDAFFKEFLAEQAQQVDRDGIWEQASEEINHAFAQFNVAGMSTQAIKDQQPRFQKQIGEAMRNLLVNSISALDAEELVTALIGYVEQQRDKWRQHIGDEEYRNFQRLLLLSAIDREWRDYLTAMDDLRREIGLEAVAQRDPKIEYKRRSFQMFSHMRRNIDESVADRFFREIAGHQEFIRQQQQAAAVQLQLNQAGYQLVKRGKSQRTELRRDVPKVGRNDPCPCGSGKKYKHCHMHQDLGSAAGTSRARAGATAGRARSGKRRRRR